METRCERGKWTAGEAFCHNTSSSQSVRSLTHTKLFKLWHPARLLRFIWKGWFEIIYSILQDLSFQNKSLKREVLWKLKWSSMWSHKQRFLLSRVKVSFTLSRARGFSVRQTCCQNHSITQMTDTQESEICIFFNWTPFFFNLWCDLRMEVSLSDTFFFP